MPQNVFFLVRNVSNIKISDIEFSHSGDLPGNDGYGGAPAMLDIRQSDGVVINNCTFKHSGFNAINLEGVRNVQVRLYLKYFSLVCIIIT